MTSCVFIGSILIPSGRNVDDKRSEQGENDVQQHDNNPLSDAKVSEGFRHNKLIVVRHGRVSTLLDNFGIIIIKVALALV